MKKMWLSVLLMACGGKDGNGADASGASLVIEPADAVLTVTNQSPVTSDYKVFRLDDGARIDVTAQASLTIDRSYLGTFSQATFSTSTAHGGQGTITASVGADIGSTSLTINATSFSLGDGVPASTPDDFANASESGNGPELAYPPEGMAAPPNLGVLDVHWRETAGDDLLEISLVSQYTTRRLYRKITPQNDAFTEVTALDWQSFADARGGSVSLRSMKSGGQVHKGGSATLSVVGEAIEGGIYYWAASATDGSKEGVYRHDMGNVGASAQAFFTRDQDQSGRCIACHAISPDGRYMAATIIDDVNQAGGAFATMVDISTRQPLYESTSGFDKWQMAAFGRNGEKFIGSLGGQMTLRETSTGNKLATIETGGSAYQPAFSPANNAVAFIQSDANSSNDTNLKAGSLQTIEYLGNNQFGTIKTLATAANGETFHYPHYSPDGKWILVNKSNGEDSYDEATAQVYIVKADGSGTPIRLATPNITSGLTNSWARWAPFSQVNADGEAFYWLTFSSKRAFGVRDTAGPQLWMAPIFPGRLGGNADPSAAAFWLPFQNINSNNHIAQWTEKIVPVVD